MNYGALKRAFPRLYSLSSAKEAKVDQFGDWINEVWIWKVDWRRSLFEWEKSLESRFLQELQGAVLISRVKDRWVWKVGEFQTY